jgi:uncharacterized protein with NRDE domain
MCLLALAWQQRRDWPMLLVANRDEFHRRAAEPARRWPQGFIAGRDLEAGGTWLGVRGDGRFAALTNYRDPRETLANSRSRGELVVDYLASDIGPGDYAAGVHRRAGTYRSFNLLVGDAGSLWYCGSRAGAPRALPPAVYTLSNHLLDSDWPKTQRLRGRMHAALAQVEPEASLWRALADRSRSADSALPDTGVPLEWERALSAAFIVAPGYGTRCSSVVALAARRGRFAERSYDVDGCPTGTQLHEW